MPDRCDFCGSMQYIEVYKPIQSRRDTSIAVCCVCGLVFTRYKNLSYSREPNPSGDADWGNIRWAKGFRLDAVRDLLTRHVGDLKICRVLDVGSNRGDFIEWLLTEHPQVQITAVEPDERVVSAYCDKPEVELRVAKLEQLSLPADEFDFVYCCQTLEHADSPSAMLAQIHACLRQSGRLFLEVPNIQVIHYPLTVEEFFIDKHTFHFNHRLLCGYLEWLGFHLEYANSPDDFLNVRVLATKTAACDGSFVEFLGSTDLTENNRKLIETYAANVKRNREQLPAVVAQIHHLMSRMKVALWGATTIFDLLVKYGGLTTQKVDCLVDQYVYKYLPEHHGVCVQNPIVLRTFQPDACIILARFSAGDIEERARKFGVRNVIKFSDLLEAAQGRNI